MMVRRILLVAFALLLAGAAPAAAQSYGDVLGEDKTQTGNNPGGGQSGNNPGAVKSGVNTAVAGNGVNAAAAQNSATAAQTDASGNLARTGADNLVALAEAAIVLIGVGSLLALVARRRRAQGQLLA